MNKRLFSIFFVCISLYLLVIMSLLLLPLLGASRDSKTMSSILSEGVPNAVILELSWFAIITFTIHLLLALYAIYSTKKIFKLERLDTKNHVNLVFLTWLGLICLVHVLNSTLYPNSFYALNINNLFATVALCALLLHLLITIFSSKKRIAVPTIITLSLFSIGSGFFNVNSNQSSSPNIIIIGIDSLRPDYLFKERSVLPFLEGELAQNASILPNAYTQLARTFPSWVSILSGLDLQNHKAIYNLIDQQLILDKSKLLTSKLQTLGYKTIYATDERRFSNIDESFGFDEIIGPKAGALDFLLGKFNDIPLNNLLTNSIIGEYLFPYNYANRASHHNYNPDSFDKLVSNSIDNSDKPIFLSVHYCLAHWPFTWSKKSTSLSREQEYKTALTRIDLQIESLFTHLYDSNLLNNTIVVFLSDHGESLGLEGDSVTGEEVYGHGTSLLSPVQNKVFLAFKYYGSNEAIQEKVNRINTPLPVTLMDIAPTLAGLIDFDDDKNAFDGANLANSDTRLDNRIINFETGFWLPALAGRNPSKQAILEAGFTHYRIDEQGKLVVKPESRQLILKSKEYGFLDYPFLYTSIPTTQETLQTHVVDIRNNQLIPPHSYPVEAEAFILSSLPKLLKAKRQQETEDFKKL